MASGILSCRKALVSSNCCEVPTRLRMHAQCLYKHADASLEDVTTAIEKLEDIDRRYTRVYGASHPQTRATRHHLERARAKLRA